MPFMFGAGVNGLFSGMSDALKIYSMYQGVADADAQRDAADKARAAMDQDAANQNTDSVVQGLRNQYGASDPNTVNTQSSPQPSQTQNPTAGMTGGSLVRPATLDTNPDKVGK